MVVSVPYRSVVHGHDARQNHQRTIVFFIPRRSWTESSSSSAISGSFCPLAFSRQLMASWRNGRVFELPGRRAHDVSRFRTRSGWGSFARYAAPIPRL